MPQNTQTYQEKLEGLIKRAMKEKNAQKALYYSQNLGGCACVSFDRFKGSWAYDGWLKRNKQKIYDIENNYHFKYW